jgi:hypothetical protein
MVFEVEGRVKENTRNFIAGILEFMSTLSILCIRLGFSRTTPGELLLIKSSISRLMTVLFVDKSMNLVLSGWSESLLILK